MKPKKKVEQTIRGKLRFTAGATFRDRLLTDVMNAREESNEMRPALHEPGIRRTFMRNPVAKLTSIAAVIAVAALSIVFWGRLSTPAYAIEQTVEALQNVRFLHIIGRDEAGGISDERWIEIGEDGYQVRYRQQNPLSVIEKHPGAPSMVIEDGESTAVYRSDKNAVILYDRKDCQYQWVSELGKAFENLLNEGQILQEDTEYQGRRAHKVWWPYMNAECYVDPETKLPMVIGDAQLSYEALPAGIFDIVTPEGYTVVDRRPGAAGQLWPSFAPTTQRPSGSLSRLSNGTVGLPSGSEAPTMNWVSTTRRQSASRRCSRTSEAIQSPFRSATMRWAWPRRGRAIWRRPLRTFRPVCPR